MDLSQNEERFSVLSPFLLVACFFLTAELDDCLTMHWFRREKLWGHGMGEFKYWENQKTFVQPMFPRKSRHYLLPAAEIKLTRKLSQWQQTLEGSKGATVACWGRGRLQSREQEAPKLARGSKVLGDIMGRGWTTNIREESQLIYQWGWVGGGNLKTTSTPS